jgi:hypothetical protein
MPACNELTPFVWVPPALAESSYLAPDFVGRIDARKIVLFRAWSDQRYTLPTNEFRRAPEFVAWHVSAKQSPIGVVSYAVVRCRFRD